MWFSHNFCMIEVGMLGFYWFDELPNCLYPFLVPRTSTRFYKSVVVCNQCFRTPLGAADNMGGSWSTNEGDPKVPSGHLLGSWAPMSLTTLILLSFHNCLQQPLDSHDISRASTHGGYRSTIAALEQEVSFAEAAFLARRERSQRLPKVSRRFWRLINHGWRSKKNRPISR